MSGRRIRLVLAQPLSLFILDIFEKERANRSRKKSESVNVSSGRSAQVGKKARHNA